MRIVLEYLTLLISLMLLLKVFDIAIVLRLVVNDGKNFVEEVFKWNNKSKNKQDFDQLMEKYEKLWSTGQHPVKYFLRKIFSKPPIIQKFITHFIFRWPTLIILQSLIVIFVSDKFILVIDILLLFVTLWAEIVFVLLSRFTMGYLDSYFQQAVSIHLLPDAKPGPDDVIRSRHDNFREFVKFFSILILVVVFGYTAIYSGLNTLCISQHDVFHGLSRDWRTSVELLYFSIVTLGTVGYGDIVPVALSARLFVASEILTGFALVVFLITAFSLTVEPESSDLGEFNNKASVAKVSSSEIPTTTATEPNPEGRGKD